MHGMSRRRWAYGVLGLLCLAVGAGAGFYGWARSSGRPASPSGDERRPGPAAREVGGDWKVRAEELRLRYPYESLAGRLAYEANAPKKPARLPAAAGSRLEETEKRIEGMRAWDARVRSLAMLHSREVERFIKEDGFGVSRMMPPPPSQTFLELPSAQPIPFDPAPTSSGDDGEPVSLPRDEKDPSAPAGLRLPSLRLLDAFHHLGVQDFAEPSGFGHVKDRKHVAGFRPHQFRTKPSLDGLAPPGKPAGRNPAKERWLLARLELVSLLKHARPAVYVSEHLPRMEDARKGKTRPLTEFEGQALTKLEKGEDLVTEATANSIRMLGSLRAAKQCLACHEVERGHLLGAFSYDLRRDPPVQGKKVAPH